MLPPSRTIRAAPTDADAIAFGVRSDRDTHPFRDGCDRIRALQRAVDENPAKFAEYLRASADTLF